MKRVMLLWIAMGVTYLAIEILWRGQTHASMLIVGGLCGVLVGLVNQAPVFYKAPVFAQSVVGAGIVLLVEFLSGCIINLLLGLDVWDYSGKFGNILGQVCVQYGLLWVVLMPFAIWFEDTARWLIYSWDRLLGRESEPPEIQPYTLLSVYKEFFLFRRG